VQNLNLRLIKSLYLQN